ncbi:MAG: tetratricopeptide repeat protein [Vicinamibacterales bacterium]
MGRSALGRATPPCTGAPSSRATSSRRARSYLRLIAIVAALALDVTAGASRLAAQPESAPVTFSRDVAPILFTHCVECHRPGGAAPFSLLTFEDARQRARLMASAVASHVMPPWQPDNQPGTFAGERRLTDRETAVFARWVSDGIQQGDVTAMPPMPSFLSGWRLGEPDLVLTMPEAFRVPADGPDVFRNFVLPIPLSERRFVRAFEFRPGNPRVVHHVRFLLDESGDLRRRDTADAEAGFAGMDAPGAHFPDGHFLGWAPGKMPTREAYPWPLEPGADLVVQMHLKPSGRREPVQASIGLYFTNTPPARTPVLLRLGSKTIDIPAGAPGYDVVDRFELPADLSLVSIYPHAHYLARDMSVIAHRPDGRDELLLHIGDWNFNWQDEYTYSTPRVLPRRTTIEMRYRYDNSAVNPRNPASPPERVRFGPGTRDEMGELILQVVTNSAEDAERLRVAAARKNLLTDVAGEEKRVADVPDDAETRNALGVAYIQLGRTADAVAQIEASLRTRPELAMAHYNLGVIAMAERRYGEAQARFERALRAQSDYPEAHNNLALVFEATGQMSAAIEHYRAAIASRPTHVAARNNLGRLLLGRGEVVGARTV